MRFFSVLTLVYAFVVSVRAAALNKREISTPIALCISDIAALENQYISLKSIVDGLSATPGYAGSVAIHSSLQTLETRVQTASADCCAMSTVTTEEGNAILNAIISLVPDVEGAMNSIVIKKPALDTVPLSASLLRPDIISLHTKSTALNACLGPLPPISIPEENNLFGRIDAAYEKVEIAFGF